MPNLVAVRFVTTLIAEISGSNPAKSVGVRHYVCCVLYSYRRMRRADRLGGESLPTAACDCVRVCTNLKNDAAWNQVWLLRHRKKNGLCTECSGFGGLEVAYWPLVPKFADSNPAEAVGFFTAKKSSACLPSEGK